MTISVTGTSLTWILATIAISAFMSLIVTLWITAALRSCKNCRKNDVRLVSSNYYQSPKTMTNGKVSYSE